MPFNHLPILSFKHHAMKLFSVSAAFAMIISATSFLGCNTANKKEKESESKTNERKTEIQELKKEYKADSIKVVSEAEWLMYKAAAEIKIKANKVRISELRKTLHKNGKLKDAAADQLLTDLEKKNDELQKRLETFKREGTDWKTFKSGFDQDEEKLKTSLKEFKIKDSKK